ncbi:SDR family oxidoreductase [Leptolyngbya sp. FACHB-541]|uniref:SDR family oxidoreductase n=1 Tax=Leptolyngbya sp. FACHB-541 TaxID=2692810 RepID=UPI00321FBA46
MSERVLVAGATGGVGQLTVAKLLEKGYAVRAMTRSSEKVQQMFDGKVEVAIADTRQPETLPAATQGITHIICCTGTTAFPSAKWDFDFSSQTNGFQQVLNWGKVFLDSNYRRTQAKNSPEQVDAQGVINLIAAAPKDLKRFVFVSSCGVEHKDKPPYSFLNAFGVLDAKQKGETVLIQSGLPYTIVRPGRLIDGPFTSYDLNTLLKATTNGKQGVVVATGDTLTGQTSRIDVAAACVASVNSLAAENKVFELINRGERPATVDWEGLFAQLPAH